jgi:MFS family permease
MGAVPTTAITGLPAWGRRYTVFVILALVNLAVWLDEGVFGALTPYWSKALHLTPTQIGTGSAAYLLGYFPLLLLAGVLSDRFGAKRMLLICVAGTALMSAGMLLVNSYGALFARNVLFGIFFGFLWAPSNRMMAIWLPPPERARYTSIWMSTTLFSFVIAVPLSLLIATAFTWQGAFLVVTVLNIPLFFAMLLLTTERPEQSTTISRIELDHIYEGRVPEADVQASEFHWRDLRAALAQRSVLFMIIATGLTTTPTWLITVWGTYGLLNGFKVSAEQTSLIVDIGIMIPVIYGFFNGWVVNSVFRGRTRPALAIGPIVSGIGFLLAAITGSSSYIAWALLIYALGFITDPFFWGTVNAYWAGIAKPEYTGTLNGISAALQVAVGYALISVSGTWVDTHVHGVAALNKIWIIGGIIFLLSAIPVYVAKEITLRRAQKDEGGPTVLAVTP